MIDVKDYGAVGDGVTDDTAAINAALLVGGRIYLPAGAYLVTASLEVCEDYTTIEGDGPASIIQCDTADVNVLTATGMVGLTVRNLRICGAGASAGDALGCGVLLTTCHDALIENCLLEHCRNGLYARTGSERITCRHVKSHDHIGQYGFYFTATHGISVEGCESRGCSEGFQTNVEDETRCADVIVRGNYFESRSGAAGSSASVRHTDRALVADNILWARGNNSTDCGLNLSTVTRATVNGNDVRGGPGYGIYVGDGSAIVTISNNAVEPSSTAGAIGIRLVPSADTAVLIRGNRVSGGAGTGIMVGAGTVVECPLIIEGNAVNYPGSHGIWVSNCHGGVVSNNAVWHAAGEGYLIDSCQRLTMNGNVGDYGSRDGILITTSPYCTLTGNSVNHNHQSFDGIRIDGISSRCVVVGNSGKGTQGYLVNITYASTGVLIQGNSGSALGVNVVGNAVPANKHMNLLDGTPI